MPNTPGKVGTFHDQMIGNPGATNETAPERETLYHRAKFLLATCNWRKSRGCQNLPTGWVVEGQHQPRTVRVRTKRRTKTLLFAELVSQFWDASIGSRGFPRFPADSSDNYC